jgi:hypothetical protein
MHRWHIGDRDIPCQVASPQSLTLLLPELPPYRGRVPAATTYLRFQKGANRPDYERYDKRGPGNPRHTLVAQFFTELHARL